MSNISSATSWIILVLLVCVLLAGVCIGLLYLFAKHWFHVIYDRPFPRPACDRSPMEINQDTIYGRGRNWFYSNRLDFQDLHITSYDGLELSAYYRPARIKETRLLVVLVHGWKDTPAQMAAFAQMYLEKQDCHILILHMRAHGMSQGRYIGYGLSDSQDLLMWTAYMEQFLIGPLKILYHGWSMGAATILIAAGSGRLSPNSVGLVADSSYDSLQSLFRYLIRRKYYFAPGILIRFVSRHSKKELGYSVYQVAPIDRARYIDIPVLIIHGVNDSFVPAFMSEALFERIQSPKRILLVQGAEHVMSYDVAPSTYSSEVDQFLRVCRISSD